MRVATVKILASFKILSCVIFLLCLNLYNHANAQSANYSDFRILRKTCLLKPEPGPCRGKITMHYFNPKKLICKKFKWGGCQGNGNRFDSNEECLSNCLNNLSSFAKTRPRYCNLNFDYGYCFGAIPRFYYDHLWKVCKERIYSGCGGNKNNFYSMEQCESICTYGNGIIKSIKLQRDKLRKVLIINPPSVLSTKRADHHIQTKKPTGAAENT